MTGDSGVGRHRSARAEGGTLTDDDGIVLEMEWLFFLLFWRHPECCCSKEVGKGVELGLGRRSSGQSCSFASSVHGSRLSQRPSRLSHDALDIPAPCIPIPSQTHTHTFFHHKSPHHRHHHRYLS